ncbi:MAG: lysophospholipid acyltransferase family protein [Opitutales bacterium]
MRRILKLISIFLSLVPEKLLEALCAGLGGAFYRFSKKRRRIILSNLSHAFPEKPLAELEKIGKTSCVRMVEMSLLSFCAGQFSEKRVKRSLEVSESAQTFFKSKSDAARPVVYLVPHFTLMEMQPWLKTVVPSEQKNEIICIYRSLNQQALEEHIKASREKHGTHFRARKEGFVECIQCLRRGGQVSILFDQNTRTSGGLVLFMGRLCAATDLPSILAKKFRAEIRVIWVERRSFWRGALQVEQLPEEWATSPEKLTAGIQIWLENQMRSRPEIIPDWLWSHNRWRTESSPEKRFSLENKKVWLDTSAELMGAASISRETRVVMRLPTQVDWVTALASVLQKIRAARPDMAFWMMGNAETLALDSIKEMTDRSFPVDTSQDAEATIQSLASLFPDTICDWQPHSNLHDIWDSSGCQQIFGWAPKSGGTASYTHTVALETAVESPEQFQEACLRFAAQFGLQID